MKPPITPKGPTARPWRDVYKRQYPVNQRDFFSFYDYEYQLDVSRQAALLDKVTPMEAGLAESYRWYRGHKDEVNRKGYIEYICLVYTSRCV